MKKIKFNLIFCLVAIFLVGLVSGCGEKTPEPTKDELIEICSAAVKENIYFDQMSDITFEEIASTEDDINALKEVFNSKVDYKTLHLTANISSITMDASIEYNCVIAYNSGWKVIKCYSVNESKWVYEAKEFVAMKDIMNDLKSVDVGPFEAGYVGDEKKSTLTINDRKEDKTINRETVYCTVKIDTDYGYYTADIEAIYYFKKGVWVIGDFVIPDVNNWKFTFNERCEIELYKNDYIMDKLNTKSEFLTYVVDKSKTLNTNLELAGLVATTEHVIYNYKYTVNYPNLGEVVYDVNISYEWLSYEWSVGKIEVSLASQDFTIIKENKYINGNTYLTIDDIVKNSEDFEIDEMDLSEYDDLSDYVYLTYFDGTDTYKIIGNLLVVLRDDLYDINIIKVTKDDKEIKNFSDFSSILLRVDNSLVIDDVVYAMCESSDLLNQEFINQKNTNESITVTEVTKKDGAEVISFTFNNGKEYKSTSTLTKNESVWTATIDIDGKTETMTIYNDNPVLINFQGNNFYLAEIVEKLNTMEATPKPVEEVLTSESTESSTSEETKE